MPTRRSRIPGDQPAMRPFLAENPLLFRTADNWFQREPPGRHERLDSRMLLADAAQNAKQEGEKAPDFILPFANHTTIHLSYVWTKAPVILSFYPHNGFHSSELELIELQDYFAAIKSLHTHWIAVALEPGSGPMSSFEQNVLDFVVTNDWEHQIPRLYGLTYALDENQRGLYEASGLRLDHQPQTRSGEFLLPATYVIDVTGTIQGASFGSVRPDGPMLSRISSLLHKLNR